MSRLRDLVVDVTVKSNLNEMRKIDSSMNDIAKSAKDAAKEVGSMEKAFGGLNAKEVEKISKSFKDLGASITKKVSLPIAGAFAASLKTVSDFDYTMADVKAKTQATNEEFEKLRNNAREVAAQSIFNPQEVAAAQAGLASAGLNPEEITQTVKHSLNLATTQNIDPDEASKLITTSLAQFQLGTEEAESVADILAATATKTNMDNALVIGESLAIAGATAKAANTNLAETAAIFGTLANVGLEGSRAGTAFNAFQRELVANTSKTGKNFIKIGNKTIDVYDKQTGKMRTLGTILSEITQATEGMTDAQRDAALSDIFSGQAINMVKMFGQAGVESFQAINSELQNLDIGFVQGMADAKMDNFKGSIESLKSSLTDAGIAIGDVIKDPIRNLADTIGGLVDKFRELSPETQQTIVKLAAIAMGVGPAISMFGKLTGTIAGIPEKIKTMKTAFTLMTSPVGLAIMGIVAAGILIYKNWDTIKEKATQLKDWMSNTWNGIKDKTSEAWNTVKDKTTETWNSIKEKTSETWNNMKEGTAAAWGFIKGKVEENGGGIKGIIGTYFEAYKGIWSAGFNFIDDLTGGKLSSIKESMTETWDNLKAKTEEFWEGIKSSVTDKLDAIKEKWEGVKEFFKNPIKGTVNILQNVKERLTGKEKGESHYQGIGYVPKDNYLANLHEGEMVLDKANAGFIRSIFGMGKGRTSSQDISKKVPTPPLEKISGSHYQGIGYIPKDNYLANLHEGEMVLDKANAGFIRSLFGIGKGRTSSQDISKTSTPTSSRGFNVPAFAPQINITIEGNPDQNTIEEIKREIARLLKEYGEEFTKKVFAQMMGQLSGQLL